IEQDNLYRQANQTRYYAYLSGGNGTEYKVTFPPYSSTTTDLGPGGPTRYIYHYDYTQSPHNYGYIYDYTVTYTNYPTSPYIPGIAAYWGAAVSTSAKTYMASNDPTLYSDTYPYSTYLINGEVFDKDLSIQTIADGSSNTILFTEGYSSCYGNSYRYGQWNQSTPGYSYSYSYSITYPNNPSSNYSSSGSYGYSYLPRI